MVVIQRKSVAENHKDKDHKESTQNLNGLIKELPKNQVWTGRKPSLRKLPDTAVFVAWFTYYVFQCLVTAVLMLHVILLISPLLVIYNLLKFVEKKWVHFKSGAIPMTGQDALWLQDSEKNRMIINTVFVLEDTDIYTIDKLRAVVERCITKTENEHELSCSRMRKCIRPGFFRYFLEEAENFDITKQVYEYDGKTPESQEEVEDLLSRLCAEDLPLDIPPWRYIIIHTGYNKNEAILLFRMRHALADGISLTRFLTEVLPDQPVSERKLVKFSNVHRMFMTLKSILVGPRILAERFLSPPDQSILHGPEIGGVKRVSFSTAIDLQVIKRIKNQTGTTVNDVMMACLSMSFHEYFKSQGINNPPDITASVPVDVRPQECEIKLENNFAIVSPRLPVSEKHILKQLHATKTSMDKVKHSGEAFVMAAGAKFLVEGLPESINTLWTTSIANKHSLVLSNVPGPATSLTVAGHKIKTIFFWPPQRDLVGIGVGMFSYDGKVAIGVHSDVNCLPKPQLIVKGFESKLAELEKCVFNASDQTEVDSGIDSH